MTDPVCRPDGVKVAATCPASRKKSVFNMKILTPIKRVPDSDQKIRSDASGENIEIQHLPFIVNPFDAIALEEAVQIRERGAADGDVEVVAVGIGSDDYEEQLRTALAVGADRAVRIDVPAADGSWPHLDPWNVACILRAVVQKEQPDLVLMGKQAIDDDSNQAGQFLAAQLGWPQATFASKIEFADEGLRVARETDAGIEVVHANMPAVLTVDLRLNEPRYASLPSILKAKKKAIDVITAESLDIAIEGRLQVVRIRIEESNRKCMRVDDVGQLVEALQSETDGLAG